MKVLLVAPTQSGTYGDLLAPTSPSLALGYLAGVLEKSGHIVKIIDMDADKVSECEFINSLKREDSELIGITTTTPTFNAAIHLSKLVKENTKAFTVLGGIHVSTLPEETMRFESVDFVVKGEGERTIVELVAYLDGRIKLQSVDGIYYRDNGKILKNKDRELISDLDEIPFPARHLYKSQNYSYPDTLTSPTFPIITSRGCPSCCTYCVGGRTFQRKFRARSSENTVDEIELLVKRFKAREIHIWDDNFVLIKSRVIRIKDEIKKRGLKLKFAIPNGVRIDCIDEDVLRALKEMGTYSIAFGVESGSQKTLDRIKKGVRLEQIEKIFKLTRKLGMEIWAFFIIGLPDEDEDTIKETIDFARKINPDIVKFHILKPFPGSEVYEEFLRHNLILDYNFNNYGMHTPPIHRLKNLSAEQILDWQKRAYRSFYLRPRTLLKQIYRLKSIHRLKLNFAIGKKVLKYMMHNKTIRR